MSPAGILAAAGAILVVWGLWPSKKHAPRVFHRVLVVGDSLGVGLQPALKALWGPRGVTVDGRSKGATHAGQWASSSSLGATLAAGLLERPQIVLVSLGTNDCHYEGAYCDAFAGRLQQIAATIRQAGAEPVFLDPPTMPWEDTVRMAKMRQAIKSAGTHVPRPIGIPLSDGIHPTPAGNEQWAKLIDGALR